MNRYGALLGIGFVAVLVVVLVAFAIGGMGAALPPTWVDPQRPVTAGSMAGGESFVAPVSENQQDAVQALQPMVAPATAVPLRGAFAVDFGLTRDALTFRNYGAGYPEGDMDVDDLRKLFGDGVCARFDGARCIPTPAAQLWLDTVTNYMRSGHCAGFTVLSSRFWLRELAPTVFAGEAKNPYDLPQNVPVMKQIARDWSLQVLPELQSATIRGTPRQIVAEMLRRSRNGDARMVDLGIFKRGGGGHSLLAYGVEEMGGQKFRIQVYDNNWPGKPLYVEVDARADTWRYSLGASNPAEDPQAWEGDAQTQSLMFVPIDPYLAKVRCPFCPSDGNAPSEVGLAVTGRNLSPQVVDAQGRRTGLVNGEFVAEIPGSRVIPLRDALFQEQAPLILVPVSAEVVINLEPQSGVSEASGNVHLLGAGYGLAVEGIVTRRGQSSRMAVRGNSAAVVLTPTNGTAPTVKVTTERDGIATLATVATVPQTGGAISVGMDANGELRISGAGAQGSSVIVARVDAQGSSVFATTNLQAPEGTELQVQVREWDGAAAPPAALVQAQGGDGASQTGLPEVVFHESLPSVRDPRAVAQVLGTTTPYLDEKALAALIEQLVRDGATGKGLGTMLSSIDPAVFDPAWLATLVRGFGVGGAEYGRLLAALPLDGQTIQDLLATLNLTAEELALVQAALAVQAQATPIVEQAQFEQWIDDPQQFAELLIEVGAGPELVGVVLGDAAPTPPNIATVIEILGLTPEQIIVLLDALEPTPEELAVILPGLAVPPQQIVSVIGQLGLPPAESASLIELVTAPTNPPTPSATPTPSPSLVMTRTSTPTRASTRATVTVSGTPRRVVTATSTIRVTAGATPVRTPTLAPNATPTAVSGATPTASAMPTQAASATPAGVATQVTGATPTPMHTPTASATAGAPVTNDDLANARIISSASFQISLDASLATTDANDPMIPCIDGPGIGSVWFRYTPAAPGQVTVNTAGSSYVTVLAVYVMQNNALVSIGCAFTPGEQATMTFQAQAGAEMYIEVVGTQLGRSRSPSRATAQTLVFALTGPQPQPTVTPGPTNTPAPPANDDWGAWRDVPVMPWVHSINVNGATEQLQDPLLCTGDEGRATVWYRYTPSQAGNLTVTTVGSTYDTVLAIFSASGGQGNPLACNNDIGPNDMSSSISVGVIPGETYYIEAAAGSTVNGLLDLKINFSGPPPGSYATPTPTSTPPPVQNDLRANAVQIQSSPFVETRNVTGAGQSVDDPVLCTGNAGTATVWYRLTATQSGQMTVATTQSNYDTVVSVWRAAQNSLVPVGCNDNDPNIANSITSLLSTALVNGDTYYIEVADKTATSLVRNLNLSVVVSPTAGATSTPTPTPTPAPPGNDDFGNWLDVTVVPFSHVQNINGATTQNADPILCTGDKGIRSVWFRYKTDQSGVLTIDTTGSSFDTVIALYSAAAGMANPVACNDNAAANTTLSQIQQSVIPGMMYYIEVAAHTGDTSNLNLVLNVNGPQPGSYTPTSTPPPPTPTASPTAGPTVMNDLRTNAHPIAVLPFSETRNVTNATTSNDDPAIACGPGGEQASVWYSVTPLFAALNVSTAGSNYDTVVAVWSVNPSSSTITLVACNDDDGFQQVSTSSLTVATSTGQTYLIEVMDAQSGTVARNLVLSVSPANGPPQ